MPVIAYVVIFSLIGSVVSLAGGAALLYKETIIAKWSHLIAAFAAGALLGTAFFDLLPEATANGDSKAVFFWALFGVLTFFLLERFVYWFHHHHYHGENKGKPTVALIMLGDSIHNFIDGVVMAATFLVSIPLGIVTSFAVAAHEIPQEIGDFGLMYHRGLSRKRILIYNFFSALISMVGALLTFFAGDLIQGLLPVFLAITSGFFIYIAASDLIPEIHEENRKGFAFYESLLLLIGVIVIWVSIKLLEG